MMSDFGIYVHWPYCAAKCPYCDFNSHVRASIDESKWTQAIIRELEWVRAAQDRLVPEVKTVFFGGGTPSLMPAKAVESVVDTIAHLWSVASDTEITLEANPASADAARFRDYRTAGINRVSLGVQAFNDADLKFLGRLHNVGEAKSALKMAMRNFERVSLDLIYARPRQTARAWRAELDEALAFGTEHLSLYQLTIEAGTPFAVLAQEGTLSIPDEDSAAALFEVTQEMTQAAGRPSYEISNHAAPGRECRHNLICWRYGDYAGVGPGAHGRLSLGDQRFATIAERLPERWQEKVARHGHGYSETSALTNTAAAREHLLMNIRLREGIDLHAYEKRWGIPIERTRIADLAASRLVSFDGTRLAATARGRLVLNSVIAALSA